VKRKNCPYFSGIIARSLPHDVLEAAEQVGISLAHQLKMGGADEILTKAKVRPCMNIVNSHPDHMEITILLYRFTHDC